MTRFIRTVLKYKQGILMSVIIMSVFFSQLSPVLAINTEATFTISNPLAGKVNSVSDLVKNFVEILSYLAVIAAVVLIIWVGFQYIMARGDSKKIGELKEWLLWIVVGLAIVIGARLIVDVVISTLASSGAVDPTVIQKLQDASK